MKKSEFEMRVEIVRDCIASLKSCRDSEITHEICHLSTAINNLLSAKLARKNEILETRKRNMLEEAYKILKHHSLGCVTYA